MDILDESLNKWHDFSHATAWESAVAAFEVALRKLSKALDDQVWDTFVPGWEQSKGQFDIEVQGITWTCRHVRKIAEIRDISSIGQEEALSSIQLPALHDWFDQLEALLITPPPQHSGTHAQTTALVSLARVSAFAVRFPLPIFVPKMPGSSANWIGCMPWMPAAVDAGVGGSVFFQSEETYLVRCYSASQLQLPGY